MENGVLRLSKRPKLSALFFQKYLVNEKINFIFLMGCLGLVVVETIRWSHTLISTCVSWLAWLLIFWSITQYIWVNIAPKKRHLHLIPFLVFCAVLSSMYIWSNQIYEGVFVDHLYAADGFVEYLKFKNPISTVAGTHSFVQVAGNFWIQNFTLLGFAILGPMSLIVGHIVMYGIIFSIIVISMSSTTKFVSLFAVSSICALVISNRALLQSLDNTGNAIPALALALLVFIISTSNEIWIKNILSLVSCIFFYTGFFIVLPVAILSDVHQRKFDFKRIGKDYFMPIAFTLTFFINGFTHPSFVLGRLISVTSDQESVGIFEKVKHNFEYYIEYGWADFYRLFLGDYKGSWIFLDMAIWGSVLGFLMAIAAILAIFSCFIPKVRHFSTMRLLIFTGFTLFLIFAILIVTDFSDHRFSTLAFFCPSLACAILIWFSAFCRGHLTKILSTLLLCLISAWNIYDARVGFRGRKHNAGDYATKSQNLLEEIRKHGLFQYIGEKNELKPILFLEKHFPQMGLFSMIMNFKEFDIYGYEDRNECFEMFGEFDENFKSRSGGATASYKIIFPPSSCPEKWVSQLKGTQSIVEKMNIRVAVVAEGIGKTDP